MNKWEILIKIIIYLLAIITGAFSAFCFIGRERNNKKMVKKYKPFLITSVVLLITSFCLYLKL